MFDDGNGDMDGYFLMFIDKLDSFDYHIFDPLTCLIVSHHLLEDVCLVCL